tara:strand:+ start:470 stop:676 length:207 start_codon:yes stop_codon:yes gene_type:complete
MPLARVATTTIAAFIAINRGSYFSIEATINLSIYNPPISLIADLSGGLTLLIWDILERTLCPVKAWIS